MLSFEEGTVECGKNRPPFQKNANMWAKNGPFFFKSRTCRLYKNGPFLSEIQNDDAYPLTTGVAGPGVGNGSNQYCDVTNVSRAGLYRDSR